MIRTFLFYFIILNISISACSQKSSKFFLKEATVHQTNTARKNVCNESSNYIPDPDHLSHTPSRQIRVNFHYICNKDGKGNFSEAEGVEYTKTILGAANQSMWKNKQMLLPLGNTTPAIPASYKYVLTPDPNIPNDDGIYFHNDDAFYFILNKGRNRNNYDKDVFEKYGVQKGKVLNVFIQDNHLDSLQSPTYTANMNGIAFDTWVKCSMWYDNMQVVEMKNGKATYPKKWLAAKQLNHEIGHVFGLRHTWAGNDGCDDTPNHPNIWEKAKAGANYSNNVMDYNPSRSAWSPCQLGRAHYYMTQKEIKRNLLIPTWCQLNKKPITIKSDIEWKSCKDLESSIIIESGASLTLRCRVSLPKGARIEILPGGKLLLDGGRLHNDCGEQWEGIELWKKGKLRGAVELLNGAIIEDAKHKVSLSDAG